MKSIKMMLPIITAMLIFLSCTKEGPVGPQGDAGPQGPQGAQGPAGTANVIYSNWVSFQGAPRDTLIDNSKLKCVNIATPKLTQALVDNAAVLVYMRFNTTVWPLPYTGYAGLKASTVSFLPLPGNIIITRFTHDNSGSVGFSSVLQFRYILIPGGVASGRYAADAEKHFTVNNETYTTSQLKAMPYNQVMALLNIAE